VNLSPEWKLLFACGKANLTEENLQLIARSSTRTHLDWEQVAAASYAHGIAPLIFHRLRRSGVADDLPPVATDALRNSYYVNAARNALLYDELRRVLLAFRGKGIDVIVLKGAALAATVYRDRALRPMSDIDLLVRKERLEDAETSLVEMGYVLGEHAMTKESRQVHDYHLLYTKSAAVNVEVHWHIARPEAPFRIDIDGLWERAEPASLAGVEALSLSVEDLLLHLCQHMHKHNLVGGIRPLCDIAHVVAHYENALDWMELRTRSSQWRIYPYVYLALYLAKELVDARVPSDFLAGFEPAGFNRAVIEWAKERLLEDGKPSPVSPNLVQLCWKKQRLKDRLAALKSTLAPQAVAKCYGVPEASTRVAFYYPRRLKDLFAQYGPVLWQLACGEQKIRVAVEREDNQQRLTKWLSSGAQ
jgi:hypothetical protein